MRADNSSDTGFSMAIDMPAELGGEASGKTPGWLLRAGLASCCATRVAMAADTAFSRAFRREYGMPPAAWRRRQAGPAATAVT